ncbi:MAG: hypothetical protein AVDCRST_MAG45-132 [uncultured Solirubrobacterales bacterium]|uniref:CmpX n=1 Tax=uncultured Solirubrobacterales bacterium TaxID=768556 RepID=A0A6J4RSH0_9ACTN|nr:MAG: hypothetical protein AVDCRST_MAG45-132 [uncultured Solirubrobacterales bacterium]
MNASDTLNNLLNTVLQAIPTIVVFLLILLVGYVVARVLRTITARLLSRVGLDRTLHNNEYGQYAERVSPGSSPSRLIGTVVFFFVLLGALSVAISYTGNPGLTSLLEGVYGYLPKIVAAILIFVIAAAASAALGGLVQRTMGDTPTGSIVKTVVPGLIMVIAGFMILDQLEIAPEIVPIAFQALLYGLAGALALAFGLGGRDVASRMINDAYEKGQEKRSEVRRDYELGKDRGQQDAEQAKQRAQREHAARGGSPGGGQEQTQRGGIEQPAPGRGRLQEDPTRQASRGGEGGQGQPPAGGRR